MAKAAPAAGGVRDMVLSGEVLVQGAKPLQADRGLVYYKDGAGMQVEKGRRAARGAAMRTRHARGFALVEAIAAVVIVVVALALLSVMLPRQRQVGSLSESIANLKQFGELTGQYGADNQEQYWTFSWRAGVITPSQYPDLRGPFGSATDAAGAQAIDIIRRLGNRTMQEVPRPANWIPHLLYSHLVLADYAGIDLPMRIAVSPEDDRRLCWSNNPVDFDQNRCQPQPTPTADNRRWPYSMSYELGVAFFSPDSGESAIQQSTGHNLYIIPGSPTAAYGGRRQSEVTYPSHKAMMWDQHQRHFGTRQPYFMYPEAKYPILFADGAVWLRSGDEANRGWNPANPTNPNTFSSTSYQPQNWEPPLPPGASPTMMCRERFTRKGLGGRDFDGDEVR
jgi:hypothetical protein